MTKRQFVEIEIDKIIDALGNPSQDELVILLPAIYAIAEKRYQKQREERVMPICFQLIRRGDAKPSSLHDVDNDICQNLGFAYDHKKWAGGWYNFIGLALAMGHDFPYIIDLCWKYEDW